MNIVDTHFLLRPMEPLFFGRPAPFNAGESHYARSMFPPSPMTFQGVIRSHLLRSVTPPLDLDDWSDAAKQERKNLVGPSGSLPSGWQLKGPLPAVIREKESNVELEPWAPVPRFLFQNQQRSSVHKGELCFSTQPFLDDTGLQDLNTPSEYLRYGITRADGYSPARGWVDPDILWWALSQNDNVRLPQKGIDPVPPFLMTTQPQPGIALTRDTSTAKDGMLYLLEHLRFSAKSGFWGHFSGALDKRIPDNVLTQGVGGAGRKARLVAFEESPRICRAWRDLLSGQHLQAYSSNEGLFWLYLLSAAKMENPDSIRTDLHYLPGNVRFQTDKLTDGKLYVDRKDPLPSGACIRCVLAMTAPPVIVGGIDTAKGTTRPNSAYIPAGSAWLLQIKGENKEHLKAILQALNNTHMVGDPEESCFGFGHTLVGIGPVKKGVGHE